MEIRPVGAGMMKLTGGTGEHVGLLENANYIQTYMEFQ